MSALISKRITLSTVAATIMHEEWIDSELVFQLRRYKGLKGYCIRIYLHTEKG